MSEKLLHRPVQQQHAGPDAPADDGPSPLLAKSAAYGNVARQANEETKRLEATQELNRRVNRSGQ